MLDDIASAGSSIHINQFGFRPGRVGDGFADVLARKAHEGSRSGSSATARAPTRR
jgi:phosphatidylserine/phosphatidylglycerophosphate/cardiolipin synthase-like enzyme